MDNPQLKTEKQVVSTQPLQFDFEYKPDPLVEPKELAGNANLSLHHHMAPPDGYDEDEE